MRSGAFIDSLSSPRRRALEYISLSPFCASHRGTPGEGSPRQNSPPDCFGSPPALLVLLGQYRTIGVCGLRSKIFCQVAQKDRRLANASQGIYV